MGALFDPDGAEDSAPALHHQTWHTSLKRHTLNSTREGTKGKQNVRLSTPALNKQGQAINPKRMTMDEFEHLVQNSHNNDGVLLQDYVKMQQKYQFDQYQGTSFGNSFHEAPENQAFPAQLRYKSAHEKTQFAIRHGFKEINRPRVGSQIIKIEDNIDDQMLNVAALLDDFEGRGGVDSSGSVGGKGGAGGKEFKKQVKGLQETIDHLKKREIRSRQNKLMTKLPSEFDLMSAEKNVPNAEMVYRKEAETTKVGKRYSQKQKELYFGDKATKVTKVGVPHNKNDKDGGMKGKGKSRQS